MLNMSKVTARWVPCLLKKKNALNVLQHLCHYPPGSSPRDPEEDIESMILHQDNTPPHRAR
ncbi:hypothetical protein MAR_033665 [Mya arenaria]|uniref:Uncharacterized protein n=1 Tax=Mya arenaria TaxID=6604 RepID=A0ABY7G9N0_MYAAR|nr:hypothetical protein MAR_033665 [Mya arenaria]